MPESQKSSPTIPASLHAASAAQADVALRIDFVGDFVCPWCYIAKRQLEHALLEWNLRYPDRPEPHSGWQPFQLNPAIPAEGIDRQTYLRSRLAEDAVMTEARVRALAEPLELDFRFDRIRRQPNTLLAHLLVSLAAGTPAQAALVESLFHHHFVEGADIGAHEVLRSLATHAGLDEAVVARALDPGRSSSLLQEVRSREKELRELGVTSVPMIVIARVDGGERSRVGVLGAQGRDALLEAFEYCLG